MLINAAARGTVPGALQYHIFHPNVSADQDRLQNRRTKLDSEKEDTMNNSSLNLRTLFSLPDPAAKPEFSNKWQEFQNRLGREIKTIKWPAAMPDLASKVTELFNVELPDLFVSS